jgi:hypothetical protein
MEQKQELLRVMRLSIEDVREEIRRKKTETSKSYKQGHLRQSTAGPLDEDEDDIKKVTDKDRIVEVLMSQERVLTLVYMHLKGNYT